MKKIISPTLIAIALGIWGIGTPAAASSITYVWTGTVTDILPGSQHVVHLGQKIGISITLDNSIPDQDPSPNRGFYNTFIFAPHLVQEINIIGAPATGDSQTATVLADNLGVDEFQISGASFQIGDNFGIDFKTSHPGVLASDSLPLSIDPHDFETATFIVNGPQNFEDFAPKYSGTIDSVGNLTQTPLPSSLGMFVPALAGLLGLGGWKPRRAA